MKDKRKESCITHNHVYDRLSIDCYNCKLEVKHWCNYVLKASHIEQLNQEDLNKHEELK